MIHRTLALMLGVVLLLAACGDDGGEETSSTTAPPAATGGTVRIGWGGAPADLNPGVGVLAEDYALYELMYDTPLTLDLEGNFIPELAKEWSVSEDELTWTMKLVDDASFHDGTSLTSADVVYTLELYRDTEAFPFMPTYFDGDEVIEAPDSTTVTVTYSQPIGNFEGRMVFMYVVPKHIWEQQEDPATFDNAEMIGSGSFKLIEVRQGEYVRLSANKEYWAGAPIIDQAVFQTFTNADARVQALINGDVDMITEFPNTAITALEAAPNVKVAVGDPLAPELTDIIFNVVEPENCPADDGVCSGHPALRDLAVRKAMAHAVDKQQLIDILLAGQGAPGIAIIPEGLGPWFNDQIQDYPFDLEEAKRILEAAGYVDSDGNGARECPASMDCGDRNELRFRLNFPDDIDTAPRLAQTLAGWWGELGIRLEIQVLDSDTLTAVCCPTFDFDIIIWGWGSDPDPGFLLSVLTCDEIPTGTSETGYCNEEYDALYQAQQVETDFDTRVSMVHRMQQILWEDLPYIIPYYATATEAYRTDRFVGWRDDASKLALEDPSSLNVIRPAG